MRNSRNFALATIVGIVILLVHALLQTGCKVQSETIPLPSVEKVVFVPAGIYQAAKTVDPELVAKIIDIYNNTTKKSPSSGLNTPDSQLIIHLQAKTKIVINNLDGVEFETHVVKEGAVAQVFESRELEQIFRSLEDQ